MPFADILGQEQALETLRRVERQGRMPHAWLFTGPAHTGRFRVAEALAQWLNCEQASGLLEERNDDACGECRACRQIAERNHPDFLVLEPDGKNIRMEQIHQAQRWLQLHADRARWRTLILDGAEHLNRESSNAFLKTLEEPPEGTLIILIAPSPEHLLETIVSRCQPLHFRPLSDDVIRTLLRQEETLSEEQITALLPQAMGSLPVDLLAKVDTIRTVQETVLQWLERPGPATLESVLSTVGGWASPKNDEWRLMLDFLERWFRDVAWLQHGLTAEHLLHPELHASAQRAATRFPPQRVQHLLTRLTEVRHAIQLNANKALALEGLWIELNHASGHASPSPSS